MSATQRQALKNELGANYRQAVIDGALAEMRTRGLASLIREKLGKVGLAEIQADAARNHEACDDVVEVDDGTRSQELAA